jgi:small subunit ribosomal protein S20
MKSRIKRAIGAIDRKEGEVETIFRDAVSSIDKAASKGVVHRNNAARKISRLARKLYKSQTA